MTAQSLSSSQSKPRLRLSIRPSRPQHDYLSATKSIIAFIAGTGAGKTVIGIVQQLIDMATYPGEQWLVVEPTWPMVDRILLRSSKGRIGLLDLLRKMDPGAIYNKGERAIYSSLGTILLASATHPESMEGAHVKGTWLDEAGQMSKLAYETGVRRASFKNGKVRLTTTPYNRGWLFKDIFQRAQRGDPDMEVIRGSSITNPAYPRETYERNKRTMSDARFRMFHEGGFERPEGMVYGLTADGNPQWDERHIVRPFPIPNDWWQGAGLDFGWNHPTAAVWIARSPAGVYFLTDEYKRGETLLRTHYDAIQKINRNGGGRKRRAPNPSKWLADPAAKQERNEMRKLGLQVQAADNAVVAGIETVGSLMATDRFKVFDTCTHWLDEVEGYIWESKQDQFLDKPVKLNDDLMDATRYLLRTEEKRLHPTLYT